mmetsp:Transcript_105582/g.265898  ORF Transcript_105582/g.265898 Transcript_105582/m.265898 type:complete len:199 (-) Transcript_105582:57-653(-)
MAAERVEKFHADASALVSSKPLKAEKVKAEITRFRTWLQKHQDESLPAGAQGKLVDVVQMYYKIVAAGGLDGDMLHDSVLGVAEDLMKLPEGKLVTIKAKKTALKWCDALSAGGDKTSGEAPVEVAVSVMLVVDISIEAKKAKVTLMDESNPETMEELEISDRGLASSVRACFDEGQEVRLEVDISAKKVLGLHQSQG